MKCDDAAGMMAGLALSELDVESRRELEEHLASCPGCRAEAERVRTTLSALKSLPPLESSEARRERAVESMSREHAARVEGILLKPRRRLLPLAAAALLLASAAALGWILLTGPDLELHVTELIGRAHVCRKGNWTPLQVGDQVWTGDRIVTETGGVIHLAMGREGEVYLNQQSSLLLAPGRRMELDRGELAGRLQARRPIHVTGVGNDHITLSSGEFEIGFRESFTLVLASIQVRPKKPDGADLVFEDKPFEAIAAEVSNRSGKSIRPASGYVAQRKVTFYGLSSRAKDLWRDFEEAMAGQGIALMPDRDGLLANLVVPTEKRDSVRHLFVRLSEGEAVLASERGKLSVRGGEEGSIKIEGVPESAPLKSREIAPWTRPEYASSIAKGQLQLPVILTLRVIGHDEKKGPILEGAVEGAELQASLEGETLLVTLGAATSTGDNEFVVPLNIKIRRN